LRSYQQLQRMVETRRGLEIIIDAASTLYDFKSMQRLAEGVLTQIASLLNVDCAGILVLRDSAETDDSFSVLAGSGCYSRYIGTPGISGLDDELREVVRQAFRRRDHQFLTRRSVLYIRTGSGRELVVLLEASKQLSETDRALIQIFTSRLSVAFDNVILYEQLQQANTSLEERVRQRTRELTRANARLSAQWTRLQRANAFKSEILGTVAHDLRNPLSVILGRTEMLTEMVGAAASSPESVKAQIVHIRTAANRLTEIVNSLIKDAMADAHDITIRPETIDIVALLRDIVEASQPLAARKDQVIAVAAPAALSAVCDPRPHARCGRQPPEQRHQVQPDRRTHRRRRRGGGRPYRHPRRRPGAGPVAGRHCAAVRAFPAPLRTADRGRAVHRPRTVHREADRRPSRRRRQRRGHRPGRHHVHDRDPVEMSRLK